MTITATIFYCIFIFTVNIAGLSAQLSGGFLDSSKDVVIREANTSIEVPFEYQPTTIFPPYNSVVYQTNNETLPGFGAKTAINAAYGLDTLLVVGSRLINDGKSSKPILGIYSYNKKTSEILDHGLFFLKQKSVVDYYCSASDPFRIYMLDYESVLWTMQTNVGIPEKAHSSYPYDKIPGKEPGYYSFTDATQPSSSADDKVHSMLITILANYTALGCFVKAPSQSVLIPRTADYIVKCKLDLSGEYLVIQEKYLNTSTAPKNGTLRIVKLADLSEQIVESKGYEFTDGVWDVGYRSIVISELNYADSSRSSAFEPSIAVGGSLIYAFTFDDTNTRNFVYGNNEAGPQDITWRNAKEGVTLDQQFACGSSYLNYEAPLEYSRKNEIICFKLSSTPSDVLVLSPTRFTETPSAAPSTLEIDPSGRYIGWLSWINTELSRVNLIMELPYQLIMPPYTQEDMKPVDYFTANVDVPLSLVPEAPVPDPFTTPTAAPISVTIEPWAWAVGAILLAFVLGAWIVFAIIFIRYKFKIAQRQR